MIFAFFYSPIFPSACCQHTAVAHNHTLYTKHDLRIESVAIASVCNVRNKKIVQSTRKLPREFFDFVFEIEVVVGKRSANKSIQLSTHTPKAFFIQNGKYAQTPWSVNIFGNIIRNSFFSSFVFARVKEPLQRRRRRR